MNPLDDALEAMQKEAILNIGSFLRGMRNTVQPGKDVARDVVEEAGRKFTSDVTTGAANAVGAAAVLGIGLGARQLFEASRKKQQFRAMLETNPDLAEHQQNNPKFFNTAYNSMRTLNPVYGNDPVVSGSLMRRMMESPQQAGGILMSTMKTPDSGGGQLRTELRAGPFAYNNTFL